MLCWLVSYSYRHGTSDGVCVMSRPIKFRAWIQADPYDESDSPRMEMTDALAFEEYLPINDLLGQVEHLMQYTGLKDKNGVEIYEGDVLSVNTGNFDTGGIGEVVWFESGSNFAVTGRRNLPHHHALPDMCERGCMHHQLVKWLVTEVIGNIYEHPELLGVKS